MKNKAQVLGAIVGAAALATSGTAFAAPLINDAAQANDNANAAAETQTEASAYAADLVQVSDVQGEFSFNQNAVTPNGQIATMFATAVSSMCSAMPDYITASVNWNVSVTNNGQEVINATVDEMAEKEGATSYVMACSCASNLAGGGAIANAEVSGITIESLATLAGAK